MIFSYNNKTNKKWYKPYNIEFSCPAASDHQHRVPRTALADPAGLLGDNCNDLLSSPRSTFIPVFALCLIIE